MKNKIFTLSFALMAMVGLNAQTVIADFDEVIVGEEGSTLEVSDATANPPTTTGPWTRIVENPLPGGINKSANVLEITMDDTDAPWGGHPEWFGVFIPMAEPFVIDKTAKQYLHFKVLSAKAGQSPGFELYKGDGSGDGKAQFCDDAGYKGLTIGADSVGIWVDFVINLADARVKMDQIEKVYFSPDRLYKKGLTTENMVTYIDDIVINSDSLPADPKERAGLISFSDTAGIKIEVNEVRGSMETDKTSSTYFEIMESEELSVNVLKINHDTSFKSYGNPDWYGINISLLGGQYIKTTGESKYIHVFVKKETKGRHIGFEFGGLNAGNGSIGPKDNWAANLEQTMVEVGDWADYVVNLSAAGDTANTDNPFAPLVKMNRITFAPGRDMLFDEWNYQRDGVIEFEGTEPEVTYIAELEYSASPDARPVPLKTAVKSTAIATATAFPNPVANGNVLKVKNVNGSFNASLISIIGQTALKVNNVNEVNIEGVQPGLYILKVQQDHKSFTTKVVIE